MSNSLGNPNKIEDLLDFYIKEESIVDFYNCTDEEYGLLDYRDDLEMEGILGDDFSYIFRNKYRVINFYHKYTNKYIGNMVICLLKTENTVNFYEEVCGDNVLEEINELDESNVVVQFLKYIATHKTFKKEIFNNLIFEPHMLITQINFADKKYHNNKIRRIFLEIFHDQYIFDLGVKKVYIPCSRDYSYCSDKEILNIKKQETNNKKLYQKLGFSILGREKDSNILFMKFR